MTYRAFQCLAVLAVLVGLMAGCGQSGKVKTVNVSGSVYLNDKPLAGAMIFFVAEKHLGVGRTGPDGKYRLEGGARPGPNQVYARRS